MDTTTNLPTLLLVDNDDVFLANACEFFEEKGYRVICASNSEEARATLKQTPIALGIIDFRLHNDDDVKDRSGLLLAREIISLSVPTIITTKFDSYEYAVDALRPEINGAAALDFVIKQYGLERLLQAVERVLFRAQIFLCYATPDYEQVLALHQALQAAGFLPWMDKKKIRGGEKWELAIRQAIRKSDFFVVCFSKNSVNRRGFMQREIRFALEIWEEQLEGDIYLIPARLEECTIDHEKLKQIQWVDLFKPDGFAKLTESVRMGTARKYRQD
jgi:DNA-binding response OmpR family regulator